MSSASRPANSTGAFARDVKMRAETLLENVNQALLACTGSKEFARVVVLMVTWDFDEGRNFRAGSEKLEMCFRDTYNYEIRRLELTAVEWDPDNNPVERRLNADNAWRAACDKVAREFSKETDMIIICYRGHGEAVETTPDQLFFASGEWDDLDQAGIAANKPARQTHSQCTFQAGLYPLQKLTKAHIVFLMDCCFSYRAVHGHNFSLLAAAGPTSGSKGSEIGFNENLIEILLFAAHSPMGITLGEIHGQLIKRIGLGHLLALPVWHPARPRTDTTASPRFQILNAPSPGLQVFSGNLSGTQRRRKNAKALTVRELGASVMLIAHLENTQDDTLKLLAGWFESVPNFPGSQISVEGESVEMVDIRGAVLGRAIRIEKGNSIYLTFMVDVLVWHELVDHPAMMFAGFYPDLRISRAQSVSLPSRMMKAVRKVSDGIRGVASGRLQDPLAGLHIAELPPVSPMPLDVGPLSVPKARRPRDLTDTTPASTSSAYRKVSDTIRNATNRAIGAGKQRAKPRPSLDLAQPAPNLQKNVRPRPRFSSDLAQPAPSLQENVKPRPRPSSDLARRAPNLQANVKPRAGPSYEY